MGPKFGGATSQ